MTWPQTYGHGVVGILLVMNAESGKVSFAASQALCCAGLQSQYFLYHHDTSQPPFQPVFDIFLHEHCAWAQLMSVVDTARLLEVYRGYMVYRSMKERQVQRPSPCPHKYLHSINRWIISNNHNIWLGMIPIGPSSAPAKLTVYIPVATKIWDLKRCEI